MSEAPTIVSLRGFPGTGKTSLLETMRSGQEHLFEAPLLRQAARDGFAFWDPSHAEAVLSGKVSLEVAVHELLGGHSLFIGDDVAPLSQLCALAGGQCRVVLSLLLAPKWMLRARRRWRQSRYYVPPEEQALLDIGPDEETLTNFEETAANNPGVECIYLDASDYPVRQITLAEARRLVASASRALPPPPARGDYHPTLRLRGKWWGCTDAASEAHTQARLDAVLPADLSGKTVLDIGANTGLFSWEALQRGAAYVVAVERDDKCLQFMRAVRDAERLPLSVCAMDATNCAPPSWWVHSRPIRYDLALLANVLHWCAEPGALLAKVLAVCDECVIETPFTSGLQPAMGSQGEHHDVRCLPPWWLEQQARENGFRVAEMRNSPIYPGYRMIMRLARSSSQ